MKNEIERDNEDWLLALSGEPREEGDAFTNIQAKAIRAALKRRAKAIEQDLPAPSEAGYHRLLFRLKREGLLMARTQQASNSTYFFSKPLAIAAVFFIGAIVVFHSYQINEESEQILYKGESGQLVIRVEDPEKVAVDIANSLKNNGIAYQFIELPRGSKQLIIPSSAEAIKILVDHKIQVKSDTQSIDILIERKR